MKRLISLLLMFFTLCSSIPVSAESVTYADTIRWDGQYDVVVAGFGCAGASAAVSAAEAGASVLLLEKAPKGDEGGNSKYSGQMFITGNGDVNAITKYYTSLNGKFEVPENLLETYANGVAKLPEIIANDFGGNLETMGEKPSYLSPEYPELSGSDKMQLWILGEEDHSGRIWNLMSENVTNRADKIDVWFESPAIALIQDPITKTILGVTVKRGDKTLNIRALNGVVLTTGGFENNPDMIESYLGLAESSYVGTGYNTGDGVRMAAEVGADMWHMNVYEVGGTGFSIPSVEKGTRNMTFLALYMAVNSGNSYIVVGGDGSRFVREDELLRHGHHYYKGTWKNIDYPDQIYAIMTQSMYDLLTSMDYSKAEAEYYAVKAASVEELAQKTGMNTEILQDTINRFNSYADTGIDIEFGRNATTMSAFKESTLYAIPLVASIANTQGGPRHNENAEIVDYNGNAIPHLYAAGELGAIFSNQYQGGGNIAECIIFGQIAGKNAALDKKNSPDYDLSQKVESTLVYTQGKVNDIVNGSDVVLAQNEYLGTGMGMGGAIRVKVTMDNDKIIAVEVISQNETEGIGDKAIAVIPGAIVAANSADVDIVASATVTSNAIISAVKDALSNIK